MIIKQLKEFKMSDRGHFGMNGYISNYKYVVTKEETVDETLISIKRVKLNSPYERKWPQLDEDFDRYNEFLKQGYSFGAFHNENLIGVVIVERRKWNNSFFIEDIEIAESHRNKGIGGMLINEVEEVAKKNGIRVISLEVQSTNVPAIDFYRKNGFELDGVDLSYYTNTDTIDGEVAFFMKKKL